MKGILLDLILNKILKNHIAKCIYSINIPRVNAMRVSEEYPSKQLFYLRANTYIRRNLINVSSLFACKAK